jgi:protein gp37
MSDLFQDGVPADFIRRVWRVMERTPQHIYQILTKRPENMVRMLRDDAFPVLPNVWLGTSVESRRYAGRIEVLKRVPAIVRFVSFEPLVGPVGRIDLSGVHWAIVGGESGPRARPMAEEWIEDIHESCLAHGAAFFFKQWGGVNKKKAGRRYRRRTWDEYPEVRVVGN